MAHLSEDKNLLKAFKNKIDIHSFTASEIFAIDIENVSTDDRRAAKAINFGLIYGMSFLVYRNSLAFQFPQQKIIWMFILKDILE